MGGDDSTLSVRLGPEVTAGGEFLAGAWGGPGRECSRRLPCRVETDYEAALRVDGFRGPSVRLERPTRQRVRMTFLPWHRRWSHSVVVALGAAAWLGWVAGPWCALAAFCAMVLHILADQLGFMGCNLFWPYTARRRAGLQLMHATDTLWNLGAVWAACLLTGWNLTRFGPWETPFFLFCRLAVVGFLLPMGIVWGVRWWLGAGNR